MLFALTKIYYPTLMDLEYIQNSNATNVKLVYVTSISSKNIIDTANTFKQ